MTQDPFQRKPLKIGTIERRGDWMELYDADTQSRYYANERTYEKCWHQPMEWKCFRSGRILHGPLPTPPTSKYKNIDSWLETRKLLNDISDQYINNNIKCIENIIALTFGDWKNLIYHLINTINIKQRNVIQQILKQEKIKYDDINTIKHKEQDNISYFDGLSATSITNICSYLNKNDIKQFKLTSTSMAIQCFLEMKKYGNVGVFNMNELRNNYNFKYLSLFSSIDANKVFTYKRYNICITNKPSSYLEAWCIKYNIPSQNILLLHPTQNVFGYSSFDKTLDFKFVSRFNEFSIVNDLNDIKKYKRPHYILIFDKNKINIIEKYGILNIKLLSQLDVALNNHVLILLYYFDIKQQYIEYNETLIIDKSVTRNELSLCIQNNIDIFTKNISNDQDKERFIDSFNSHNGEKCITVFLNRSYVDIVDKTMIVVFSQNNAQYIAKCKKYQQCVLEQMFFDYPWDLANDIIHRLQIKKQFININQTKSSILNILGQPMQQNIFSFLSLSDISRFSLVSTSIAIVSSNALRKSKGFQPNELEIY